MQMGAPAFAYADAFARVPHLQALTAAAQRAEEEAGPPEEWTEAQLPPLPDVTTDAVRAALAQLQQLLQV